MKLNEQLDEVVRRVDIAADWVGFGQEFIRQNRSLEAIARLGDAIAELRKQSGIIAAISEHISPALKALK